MSSSPSFSRPSSARPPAADVPSDPRHFVGLANHGATGYMNVILQQLFLTPGFTAKLLRIPFQYDADSDPLQDPNSMLFHLRDTFEHLKDSQEAVFVPRGFWENFRFFGIKLGIHRQIDAFEFYNALSFEADELLDGNKQLFGDYFNIRTILHRRLKGCRHPAKPKQRVIPALVLKVRGVNTLTKSLNLYFKEEKGEGKYRCKECRVDQDYTVKTRVLDLPGTLIVQLIRYGYDPVQKKRYKVNDRYTFPTVLDLAPYLDPKISLPDVGGLLYDLSGIVVHRGDTDGGQYVSYGKDRGNGRWYQFSDEVVHEIELTEVFLSELCFGGPDGNGSAYILFYDEGGRSWNRREDIKLPEGEEENDGEAGGCWKSLSKAFASMMCGGEK